MAAATDGKKDVAVLRLPDGKEVEIPIRRPTYGDDLFLDLSTLHRDSGCFTYDPGFTCTASCESSITYIDGAKGICLYRGYPVQDLVERAGAEEVAYLLLTGELPTQEQREHFLTEVKAHRLVHVKIQSMFQNFTINSHPMAIMVAVVGGLSSIFHELDPFNPDHRWLACTRLIAKVPMLASMAYKTSIGQPIMYPKSKLSCAENFLYMMFATPMEEYEVNPVCAKAINAFMILHMDHEQNASTSTVRIAGSSQANPYACIAAGIASLWGPAHGGANEAVIRMLAEIGTKDKVRQFVDDVKAKKDGVRLMGFGHRVYKSYDPRAKVMKGLVEEVLRELGVVDPLLEVAQELEKIALTDEYFVKRSLYPNVDYYSGIMLRAIGIPTSMFTVMFAMSRTVGWVSQWKEMFINNQMKIGRPRQLYNGTAPREYPIAIKSNPPSPQKPVLRKQSSEWSKEQAMREESSTGSSRPIVGRRNSGFSTLPPPVIES